MFECLLQQLVSGPQGIKERADGVAFLNVAKSTYPISAICYVGLNIPLRPREDRFVQCTLADHWVKHCVSKERLGIYRIEGLAPAFIIEELDDGRYTVFVPSIPTPFAGAVYVLDRERVFPLDVPFTDAIKVVSRWGSGAKDLVAAMEKKAPSPV